MSRYAEVLAPLIGRLGQELRGWMLVRCAPTEEPEVAAVLAAGLGWPQVSITDDLEAVGSCVITIPRGEAVPRRPAADRAARFEADLTAAVEAPRDLGQGQPKVGRVTEASAMRWKRNRRSRS